MISHLKGVILIILIALSGLSYGQEAVPDTASVDTVSYFNTAYNTFAEYKPQIDFIQLIIKILWALLSIILAALLWRYLIRPLLLLTLNSRDYRDETVIIFRLLLIIFVSYFVVIKIFNPGDLLTNIIYATAGLSIAIGTFDFMRNLISGLSILIRRSIKLGDKIKLEDISGKVIKIGLGSTKVEHPDGTILIIPNHQLSQSIVQKQAAADSIAPVDVNFYLPPDIDIVQVKEIAHRAASLSRFVYLNNPISVNLTNEFSSGRSLLNLRISAYVLNIDYVNQFKSDITENVLSEIIKKDILSGNELSFGSSEEK